MSRPPAPSPAPSGDPRPGARAAGAHPRYIAILALAAAVILVVGGLFRPRSDEASTAPQPPEGELARLRQPAQRRSLLDQTEYFRAVAAGVGPAVAYLPARGVSAVAWGVDRLVTVGAGPAETPGRPSHNRLRPRARPVVAVDAVVAGAATPSRADALVAPGDWIVAIWDGSAGRAFVPGHYTGTAETTCGVVDVREVLTTLPLSRPMAAAGLFDLYGSLVGLVVPCGGRLAAITATSVDTLLAEAATVPGRLLDLYGLDVADVPSADGDGGKAGVSVRTIWIGEIGDASGLRPGDLIVGLDGAPVVSMLDLAPIAAGAPVATPVLDVVRVDGTREDVRLERTADAAVSSGVVVETVPGDSAAARAGVLVGDRIIRVDGRTVETSAQAAALIAGRSGSGALVEVERDDHRWAVRWP